MNFHYDKQEDALYIRFDKSSYLESEELQDGLIVDYNKNGKIIGREVLGASKKFSQKFRNQFIKSELPLVLSTR